jgi:membrane protein YdbS with pleckstrin-like domain
MRRQEENRIIWRKHWMVLVVESLIPLSLFALTLVLALGPLALPRDLLSGIGLAMETVATVIGLLALAWFAWIYADWRNDTYEVDDIYVVDTEKKPLFFAEKRRTARLGQIENIEFDIPGPLHYMLNFGNVKLQTAAEEGDFTFDWVPEPRDVAEELRRRIQQYHRREEDDRARQRAEELPDWFEAYNRLEADTDWPART